MDTEPFVQAVKEDLATALETDEALAEASDRITRSIDASIRLHLLDAVGRAAVELSDQLPSGRVDVRLAGRDVQLVYVADLPAPAPEPDDAGTARITLRLPEALKERTDTAAAEEGISTNTWLVRAVSRGLDDRRPVSGRRITGLARG